MKPSKIRYVIFVCFIHVVFGYGARCRNDCWIDISARALGLNYIVIIIILRFFESGGCGANKEVVLSLKCSECSPVVDYPYPSSNYLNTSIFSALAFIIMVESIYLLYTINHH